MKTVVTTFVAAFALMLAAAPGIVNAQTTGKQEVEREKFDPKRDAAKDIANAVTLAKKQNKRIILDVGGEWCGWCHKLDKMFKTDQEVAQILKEKYIVVKVNFSQENENKEVLSKYPKIQGYPHLFVLDKTGKLLHSQDTGLLEVGANHDHDKVMTFLKKWAS